MSRRSNRNSNKIGEYKFSRHLTHFPVTRCLRVILNARNAVDALISQESNRRHVWIYPRFIFSAGRGGGEKWFGLATFNLVSSVVGHGIQERPLIAILLGATVISWFEFSGNVHPRLFRPSSIVSLPANWKTLWRIDTFNQMLDDNVRALLHSRFSLSPRSKEPYWSRVNGSNFLLGW